MPTYNCLIIYIITSWIKSATSGRKLHFSLFLPMFIDSFTATAQETSKKFTCSKPIAKVLLTVLGATSFLSAMADREERIVVELNSRAGKQVDILPNTLIAPVGVYSGFGAGVIHESVTRVDGALRYRTELTLALSPATAVRLLDTEDMTIRLTNLVPGTTYEVCGIELSDVGTNMYDYNEIFMPAGTRTKDFNVDAAVALVIPTDAGISKISISFANGYIANYTIPEIKSMNSDYNDLVGVINYDKSLVAQAISTPENPTVDVPSTVVFSSHDAPFLVLMCKTAVSVEITSDASSAVNIVQVSIQSRLA
jgi:hypothetical protein